MQEIRTVMTLDAAMRHYPGECFLSGVSLLMTSQDGDVTGALLAQDLLHNPSPVHGRNDASPSHWGGRMLLGIGGAAGPLGNHAYKTLHGAWLLATRRAFPRSVIWKDLGMAWLKFLGNEGLLL